MADWTPEQVLEVLQNAMAERDVRYEQRFLAQERAVQIALEGSSREFHEHLNQYRDETRVAMEAAEKAIDKAERATELRFSSVNEFRAQLADQVNTFLPRTEAHALIDKVAERTSANNTRLDKLEGASGSTQQARTVLMGALALVLTLVGIAVAVAVAVLTR